MPEQPNDLLSLAEATPLARGPVAALAEAAPAERLIEALERALDGARIHAATVLALAIGVAGARIPAPLVTRLAPDLDNMGYLLPLAGIVDGDRLTFLLDLAATGRLSWEREATVLMLAARLLDGAEPPLRLTSRLRSLLREPLTEGAMMVASMASVLLKDPEVHALAGKPMLAFAAHDGARRIAESMWQLFTAPVRDCLPEHAAVDVVSGYTVMRAEPKVGRNEPCPCGSGRKYKKCCAGKEHAAPVPRSLVEQFQDLGPRAPRVQQQLFERMRPGDLERLDPEQLTTLQVIDGFRRLAVHHRWDAAERFVAALERERDFPITGYRVELVDMALDAGELDVAERQMALASPDEREQMVWGARLALVRRSPDALDRLEVALREGHADHPVILIECAFSLLRHTPALGILAARGAMSVDRLLDSEELLNSIGRARDTLGLPAEEPWEQVFDLLLDARSGEIADEDEEEEDRDAEIAALRANLRAAADRARRLDEDLARRERQLEAVSGERERLAATVEAQKDRDDRRRVAELEQERQRLRTKIAKLKGEVAEGAEQRAQLRRELARSADERSRKPVPPREPHDELMTDDEEGDAVVSWPRSILIPQFSTAASRSLAAVPARVAADALQEAARLAGGDVHAWSGAKHMRRAHEVLSVRVGRPWRLLFRLSEDRLEVLDLIRRRDLDNAIARVSRS